MTFYRDSYLITSAGWTPEHEADANPPPPWGSMLFGITDHDEMDLAVRRKVDTQLYYLEMMAAAYFAVTQVDPREVVLVREDNIRDGRSTFFYCRRDELNSELERKKRKMSKDTQADRQSQVSEQCSNITNDLEELFKNIERLEARLEAVLLKETKPEPEQGKMVVADLVGHANQLRDFSDRLRAATRAVVSIRERLEI